MIAPLHNGSSVRALLQSVARRFPVSRNIVAGLLVKNENLTWSPVRNPWIYVNAIAFAILFEPLSRFAAAYIRSVPIFAAGDYLTLMSEKICLYVVIIILLFLAADRVSALAVAMNRRRNGSAQFSGTNDA